MTSPYFSKVPQAIISDPHLAVLDAGTWRFILECYLVADQHRQGGRLPDASHVAFWLRMDEDVVIDLWNELDRFFAVDEDGVEFLLYDEWQGTGGTRERKAVQRSKGPTPRQVFVEKLAAAFCKASGLKAPRSIWSTGAVRAVWSIPLGRVADQFLLDGSGRTAVYDESAGVRAIEQATLKHMATKNRSGERLSLRGPSSVEWAVTTGIATKAAGPQVVQGGAADAARRLGVKTNG